MAAKQGAGLRGHFHGVYVVPSGLLLKCHALLSPQEAVGDNRTPLLSHSISCISAFYLAGKLLFSKLILTQLFIEKFTSDVKNLPDRFLRSTVFKAYKAEGNSGNLTLTVST